jgi:hypothetical protein
MPPDREKFGTARGGLTYPRRTTIAQAPWTARISGGEANNTLEDAITTFG